MSKPEPPLSRQVAGAMFWNVALFPLKFVVGLAAGIVVPNLLGLERYSLYILIVAVASTIGSYADLGMERALPRYIPEVAHRFGARGLRRFLYEVVAVKLTLLLLLVLLFHLFSAPLLGYMQRQERSRLESAQASLQQATEPEDRRRLEEEVAAHQALLGRLGEEGRLYLWTISAMLLLGAVFDVGMRLLLSYFRQRVTNTIEVVVSVLQPLLIIVLVLVGWDVKGVLVALVATPLVAVGMVLWRVRRAVGHLEEEGEEEYRRPGQVWPRFLSYAGIAYIINLSVWLYDLSFLSLVVAAYLSTRDVGSLGIASKFVGLFLSYLMVPLSGINIPLFAHLYARESSRGAQEAFSVLTQFLLLLLVPTGVGLALLSPSLMPLLYASFPPETVSLVLILILAMFLEAIIGLPMNILLVHERYGPVVLSRLSALVILPLLALLVPRYGLVGVAAAAAAARLLSRGIAFFYGLRHFALRFPLRFAGRVGLAAAAMTALLYPLTRWWGITQITAGWAGRFATLGKDLLLALAGAVVFGAVFKAGGGLESEARRRLEELRFPGKGILLKLL